MLTCFEKTLAVRYIVHMFSTSYSYSLPIILCLLVIIYLCVIRLFIRLIIVLFVILNRVQVFQSRCTRSTRYLLTITIIKLSQ
jgi:hypothetical protein